ncbi:predicted protein [Uncinocarpus reesii 1704]|uniref:BZIP domain-containing protein n=1 Tax=Uncinocarpus reesii (strain UAMH 1704) TaxID=336963 RepID=C4JF83_UNCRE|nr:uncharacterized protein UREG_02305 [Uncinocarpus reesii 1704]EEP77456.1 predicted protein [Uncinocarpus reesii 1704]
MAFSATGGSSSSTPLVPSYSLPNAGEVSIEDDWTGVQNRKEKKRIQNRVAQRSYPKGQRMKARLAELQAKVAYHEQARSQLNETRSNAPENRVSDPLMCAPGLPTPRDSGSPKATERLNPRLQAPPPAFEEQPTNKNDRAPLDNPQGSQSFSQARSPLLEDRTDRASRIYDGLFLDHMHVPKQQLGRLNHQVHNPFPQEDSAKDNTTTPFATAMTGDAQSSVQNFAASSVDLMDSVSNTPSSPPMSASQASLDERFELIMECVAATGFDSFDTLVTAYYNETFGESSPLANEQRLSRNRRLPRVIADVFDAAGGWSPWERRGFHEEILKTTETMLLSESDRVRNVLNASITSLTELRDRHNTSSTEQQEMLATKRMIQNELPNRWALMMALAAENRAAWQRDRSDTALAAILLLHCAGRLPKEQLLKLLGDCLSNVP